MNVFKFPLKTCSGLVKTSSSKFSGIGKMDFTIPVPWGHIAGITFGEHSSPSVLCIHGYQDNLATFKKLIPLLPKGKHVYYVD